MDAKLNIFTDTFKNRFEPERFRRFATEFFGGLNIISPDREITNIPTEYKYTVESYQHMATYTTDGGILDVFAVRLQSGKGRTVERARSMQRNFIASLLKKTFHDAALVAFYTDDDNRWRLSFVKLEYKLVEGRGKENLSPAKRYSYLVGENEPCHTAMAQLYPIFRDENFNPSLDHIEEAFSVERVTKDFFEQYKERYFVLKEYLDNSETFNEEAARCGFTSEQFAKKLMGQLAFLYFLQKKGWLGVRVLPPMLTEKEYKNVFYHDKLSREIIPQIYQQSGSDEYKLNAGALKSLSDEDADIAAGCFKADEWGKGEKSFLRHLFTSCKKRNFFNEYLEPLFYEALNRRRGTNNFYRRFNCKIPFLNGGLFEPLEGYNWSHNQFDIPNDIFSNIAEKGEHDADGILDIFDRYNFTMNEDEPLEREVAVDPEMLGKIFENLLDAKDRKSKGAFYTPREIVHYMCAESLVNYLVGKTGVPYDDMKAFIVDGEFMKDEDYNNRGTRRLPQTVYDNLREIDKALETIRIADPAVGSGAFPLGMLSEIVKARNNITYYYAAMLTTDVERARIFKQRDPYTLKRQTIQECIFAVDIEASAVDIAKLRLWLSLVVDEDLTPSYDEIRWGEAKQKDPRSLPNLDYNIMCGNSLIDEFEGIQLFDDTLLGKGNSNTSGMQMDMQMSLFVDSMDVYLEDLRREQERLFGEENQENKLQIKQSIDKTIDNIIRAKLERDKNIDGLRKYEESLKQKTKPYFLWKLEFARVFREKGGFDVVIGNPPYVFARNSKAKGLTAIDKEYFYKNYTLSEYQINLYPLFIEMGTSILKNSGCLCFITPNNWLTLNTNKLLRQFVLCKSNVTILNFYKRVFESADVDAAIVIFNKNDSEITNATVRLAEWEKEFSLIREIERGQILNKKDCIINVEALKVNETYSFLEKIENRSFPLSNYSKIKCGLGAYGNGDGIPPQTKEMIQARVYHSKHKEDDSWYKYIEGEDVKRYECSWNKQEYLKYGKHLREPRNDWNLFSMPRILVRQIPSPLPYCINACFVEETFLNDRNSMNIVYINSSPLFLLGVLNSRITSFWFANKFGKLQRGIFPQFKINELAQFPIPDADEEKQEPIIKLVRKVLEKKQSNSSSDTSALEAEIDRMVYELYGLTDDEIAIVEGV